MWTGMMHGREPMSKVDTAWLRMESPTNRMMITGVMVFSNRLPLERLNAALRARFLKYRRFTQRVRDLGTQAFWEDDESFDLGRHVVSAQLPRPANEAALQAYVSELASTALDDDRPLWQFHLIEKFGQGSALIVRMHHCYADGMALVQVMLSLTDTDGVVRHEAPAVAARKSADAGFLEGLFAPTVKGMGQVSGFFETAVKKVVEFGQHPQIVTEDLTAKAKSGLREVSDFARELGAALTLSDDPQTAFKGRLSADKRVAWCPPLRLDEVKIVGRALGGTVNDVLLACAAGALRSYLLAHGSDVDGLQIRASVPVNLRKSGGTTELGNHFGLVFVPLPIGVAHPLERLIAVRDAMRELKQSRQAMVTFGLLSALGVAPVSMQKPAFEMLSRKATLVATNVPGPSKALFLNGAAIEEMMFWVPQTGSIGLGISLLSYNGRVHFGVVADAHLVPNPQEIVQRFAPELEKLVMLALLSDESETITEGQIRADLRKNAAARPSRKPPKAKVQPLKSKVPNIKTPNASTRGRSRVRTGSVS